MCRRAGTKTGWASRWPGFGITTGTRMASWPTKICRTGRPPQRPRRNSAARTAAPGLADGLGVWGAAVLRPTGTGRTLLHKKATQKREPRKRLALRFYCASYRRLLAESYLLIGGND